MHYSFSFLTTQHIIYYLF